MVNSICLTIFIKLLWDCHSFPIDLTCAWTHTFISYSLVIIYPSGSDSTPGMSCSRQFKPWMIVGLCPFNLLIFWLEHLLLVPRFGNHNSFAFKLWNYQIFPKSDASALFLLLIEYRYSHQLRCGSPDPLLDYHPTVSFIFKEPREVLSQIHNAFGNCILSFFFQPCSAFELLLFTSEVCGIGS